MSRRARSAMALAWIVGVPSSVLGQGPTPSIRADVPPSGNVPTGERIHWPAPALVPGSAVDSGITFTVTFDDGGLFTPWHSQLSSHLLAAGQQWAAYLGGTGQIDIVVRPFDGPRFGGRSLSTTYVANEVLNGSETRVYMQGAAGKLRTGVDPNGSDYDIEISIGQDLQYLSQELWFDPDPNARTAPVPLNQTDAMSVCLHELGHAWGFNGWRDRSSGDGPPPFGTPPLPYLSTFDTWLDESQLPDFAWQGPATSVRYGADVPLTAGNIFHYGNAAPGPGSDLIPFLMNGVVFYRGSRYFISPLELATLADANVLMAAACYANCDGSTGTPSLTAADFSCFLARFRAGNAYANCDGSTGTPSLTAADFTCFLSKFRAGCP